MKASDLLKAQILSNQIQSLMAVNNEISKQIDLRRERLYEVKDLQVAVNEQLDKYKGELSFLDDLIIPDADCIKTLNLTNFKTA